MKIPTTLYVTTPSGFKYVLIFSTYFSSSDTTGCCKQVTLPTPEDLANNECYFLGEYETQEEQPQEGGQEQGQEGGEGQQTNTENGEQTDNNGNGTESNNANTETRSLSKGGLTKDGESTDNGDATTTDGETTETPIGDGEEGGEGGGSEGGGDSGCEFTKGNIAGTYLTRFKLLS